jgi:hypothetical protein
MSVPVIVHVRGAGLSERWCVTAWTVAQDADCAGAGPGKKAFVGIEPHELGHGAECATRPVMFVAAEPPLDPAEPSPTYQPGEEHPVEEAANHAATRCSYSYVVVMPGAQ